MSAKIKVSYEKPEELQEVLDRLRPMVKNVKVQPEKGKYKRAYVALERADREKV